jgi:integrase/recombinase XerD
MVKRRARVAGLSERTCCHTFRATGITAHLEDGGTIEDVQHLAGHADPRTTRHFYRRSRKVTRNIVERNSI